MDTKVKILLDSNPNYKVYLRTNSYLYKSLNRDSDSVNTFINEVKERYRLRPTDKINDFIDKLDMVSKFINVLR